MPNYCENKITLSGDSKEVKEAFSFMASPQTPLDFNKIIPYPKEFEDKDKEFETLGWDGYKAKYGHIKDGFNSGGYEWCVGNWGTKWNAIEAIRTDNTIEFQTAWSPPYPIISAIHANNPQIGIRYTYNEPGMCFAGMQVFQPAGEDTESVGKPTQDHYWEGEDYAELYPYQSLKYAFEEALFEPPNPLSLPTRDQLTKREEETALAAIKELTTLLVDGCFQTDTGPTDKDAARFELTKLGNTLKVLIDEKFESEIRDVIDTVATTRRGELIEKETSKMADKNTSPKKTNKGEVQKVTRDQLTKKQEEALMIDIGDLYDEQMARSIPLTEKEILIEFDKISDRHSVVIDGEFKDDIDSITNAVKQDEAEKSYVKAEDLNGLVATPEGGVRQIAIEEIKSTLDKFHKANDEAAAIMKKEPAKKKTVVPEKTFLSLEEAKKKALSMALELKDNGEEEEDYQGLSLVSLLLEVSEDDRDELMDYLSGSEFSEAVEELNPKISELSDDALNEHLERYRRVAPYKGNNPASFMIFMANAAALSTAIGGEAVHLNSSDLWNYVKDLRLPFDGNLIDRHGHFVFPEGARAKIKGDPNPGDYTARLTAWGNWNRIKGLFNRPDQIPQDLQDDMQSSLLRMLLGMDNYPRIGDSHYSNKQFHIRDVLHNRVESYTYTEVAKLWESFLRTYRTVLQATAARPSDMSLSGIIAPDGIAELITRGQVGSQIAKAIEEIELAGWYLYATERVFQEIKNELEKRAAAKTTEK